MSLALASLLVGSLEAYLGAGLLFALLFVVFGVDRVDPAAHGSGWGFRAILVPGSALLWPLLLVRWLRAQPPPEEVNAHRIAARARSRR